MEIKTPNQKWAMLLLDFENTNPTKEQRELFSRYCCDSSHMENEKRINFIRSKIKVMEK